TLRNFHQFLLNQNIIEVNPAVKLTAVRGEKKLPEYLTIEEMEILLNTPDASPAGITDNTLMEVLYASAIRVSELINIKRADVNKETGFIQFSGKSSKESIVHSTYFDAKKLDHDVAEIRPQLLKTDDNDDLFITNRDREFTRQGLWKTIKKYELLR